MRNCAILHPLHLELETAHPFFVRSMMKQILMVGAGSVGGFFGLCKFGKKIGKRSGIDNTFRQGKVSVTIIATRAWA